MALIEPAETSGENPAWERRTLEKLLMASLIEQRRRRRWGIFFKLLFFIFAGIIIVMAVTGNEENATDEAKDVVGLGKHTAVVSVRGVISESENASAANVIKGLRAAVADKKTAGVIVRIDSPGGSPVQAGLINDEIVRLRSKYPKIPFYTVVEDLCASGGYYVAVAADKIFVDKASIVGSIGVLMNGFGFVNALDKLGIERRLITAGENKGFLDPFSPQNAAQKTYAQSMLTDIHRQFIAVVKKGRGERLKETPEMFSGLMWTGEKSIALGLADAYGSVSSVARQEIKAEVVHDFTYTGDWTDKLSRKIGAQAAAMWRMALEQQPLWR